MPGMRPEAGFHLLPQAVSVIRRFAARSCLARRASLDRRPGGNILDRGTATPPEERDHTGQSEDSKGQSHAPQGNHIPSGRQETDLQRIAPLRFQRTGLPQQALKMRERCFRDGIFFQQDRDSTAPRCPAFFLSCPIQADEDFCPAAVFQQWPQDPQGLSLQRHFLFPAGRLVRILIWIQAPSFRIEDKDVAFVRAVRYQGQDIQHPVQSRGIRHGVRP